MSPAPAGVPVPMTIDTTDTRHDWRMPHPVTSAVSVQGQYIQQVQQAQMRPVQEVGAQYVQGNRESRGAAVASNERQVPVNSNNNGSGNGNGGGDDELMRAAMALVEFARMNRNNPMQNNNGDENGNGNTSGAADEKMREEEKDAQEITADAAESNRRNGNPREAIPLPLPASSMATLPRTHQQQSLLLPSPSRPRPPPPPLPLSPPFLTLPARNMPDTPHPNNQSNADLTYKNKQIIFHIAETATTATAAIVEENDAPRDWEHDSNISANGIHFVGRFRSEYSQVHQVQGMQVVQGVQGLRVRQQHNEIRGRTRDSQPQSHQMPMMAMNTVYGMVFSARKDFLLQ